MQVDDISKLARARAWPAVALVAIGLFFGPVGRTLNSIADKSSMIKVLKVGGLELDIDENNLPKPDADTTQALKDMPELSLIVLMEFNDKVSANSYCKNKLDAPGYWVTPLDDLKTRGLVTYTVKSTSEVGCESLYFDTITERGKKVREYVGGLLAALLKSASVETPSSTAK